MKKFLLAILIVLGIHNNGFGQNGRGAEIVIGKRYTLQSERISGKWDIEVSLPDNYESSDALYPVVYALHGDYYFNYAVGGFQRLVEFGDIPQVIIVGISNESNSYFAYGSKRADQFLDFMAEDIFPFIEKKYRTHLDRTVLGWHYTSGFIFHALSNRPDMFKNYIPISPYLGGYDVSKIEFNALEQLNARSPELKKSLYFGALSNERSVKEVALSLDSLLKKKAPKNLDWSFELIEPDYDEGIGISVYRLWNPGLKTVYKDYKNEELSDWNIEAYKTEGGLAYLENHYQKRAERFGGESSIPELFSLTLGAMRANEFTAFDELVKKMKGNLQAYNLNRILGFATYYLSNANYDEAMGIYDEVNGFYPNSISIYEGMALVRVASGKIKMAIKTYQRAIELARLQSDERLEVLEKSLAELK